CSRSSASICRSPRLRSPRSSKAPAERSSCCASGRSRRAKNALQFRQRKCRQRGAARTSSFTRLLERDGNCPHEMALNTRRLNVEVDRENARVLDLSVVRIARDARRGARTARIQQSLPYVSLDQGRRQSAGPFAPRDRRTSRRLIARLCRVLPSAEKLGDRLGREDARCIHRKPGCSRFGSQHAPVPRLARSRRTATNHQLSPVDRGRQRVIAPFLPTLPSGSSDTLSLTDGSADRNPQSQVALKDTATQPRRYD